MKTPENDQQKLFFDLIAAGTSVRDAAAEAEYTYRYGYELLRNYKEYLLDCVEQQLVLHAGKAAKILTDGLSSEGTDMHEKTHTTNAKDILDRVGLVKRDRLDVTVDSASGLVIIPSKVSTNDDKDKE
jgi:hypothetical protein|tara:strand:- start:124 stop:507 length:384 start_codon:yes stop_codon:yes gene_type:complete